MEIFQYCNTFWIITVHLAGYEIPSISTQRVLAAITTLLLWLKVLDWLKLFRPTSFFIQLIAETIYGIRYFFMIYLVAIFMFGVPIYILNFNRTDENAIITETFG